jgi:hypothetical protein
MLASNISNIDWELVGKAFPNLTTAKKWRVMEHAACHFVCGKMMQIWQFQDHAECPHCSEQQEDPPHILNFAAPLAALHWKKALTVLEVWMTANHAIPDLHRVFLKCLEE